MGDTLQAALWGCHHTGIRVLCLWGQVCSCCLPGRRPHGAADRVPAAGGSCCIAVLGRSTWRIGRVHPGVRFPCRLPAPCAQSQALRERQTRDTRDRLRPRSRSSGSNEGLQAPGGQELMGGPRGSRCGGAETQAGGWRTREQTGRAGRTRLKGQGQRGQWGTQAARAQALSGHSCSCKGTRPGTHPRLLQLPPGAQPCA